MKPWTFWEENHCIYVLGVRNDGVEMPVEVANFTARVVHKILGDEKDLSWKIQLTNGNEREVIEVKGKELVSLFKFREKLGDKGVFLYNVTSTPLHNKFLQYLFRKSRPTTIQKTQYLGKLSPDLFLFSNLISTPHGIKEMDDLLVPPEGKLFFKKSNLSMKKIISEFVEIYEGQAWKALGFAVASLFVEEISEQYGFFPVLFLYGRKGSGKNTLAEILTAFFGAHREIRPFNFNSTEKSKQRTSQKYRGIPITINEYQNNPKNNKIISSFYDREGYHRAVKDDSMNIQRGEVNSTLMVLSTQNISGKEAEAVLSRLVEIDMNWVKREKGKINHFRRLRDDLSLFVDHCMRKLTAEKILEAAKNAIEKNLEIQADTRIIENYSILQSTANLFFSSLGLDGFRVENIEEEILRHDEATNSANAVENFLNLLEIALAQGSRKIASWARINVSTRELIFSLKHVHPILSEGVGKSGMEIPDVRTVQNALGEMGGVSRMEKIAGRQMTAWVLSREEKDFFHQQEAEMKKSTENFLSLLESLILSQSPGIQKWARIFSPEGDALKELQFNLKHAYPLVEKEAKKMKISIPDAKALRRTIKGLGAVGRAVNMEGKVVKAWVVGRC